jgi:uncharacterized protein
MPTAKSSSAVNLTLKLNLLRTVAVAAVLALTGCQTYTSKTQERDESVRSGNFAAAVAEADKDAENNADNKDTILYRLEQGAILRAAALANLPAPATAAPAPAAPSLGEAGQTQTNQALNAAAPDQISPRIAYLTRSVSAFDEAARRIARYEEEAKIKVGSEAGAILTNQANLPYRGRAYDKVMLHTYQALNYLQLRDSDAARVELNRALQSQRDAVEDNAKRIQEAQKIAEEAKSGGVQDEKGRQGSSYDVDRAQRDPKTSAALSSIESKLDAAILPYGDYVNPFTTFLDALVFTHQAADASDVERARKSWERVAGFAPNNPYAQTDYRALEPDPQAPATPAPAALTYVIFETGAAPYREQIRIDLPLFVVTGRISYVGMALPELSRVSGHAPSLTIAGQGGQTFPAALVASMDSVVSKDFKNEWPSILTKTIISTATKATIDAVLQKQMQDQAGPTGALLFSLATAVTQAAVNIADTRTWRSLPKEFHYARLATPSDGLLTLTVGAQTRTVSLEPAAVQVVYVKSTSASAPFLVGQFILKK